VGIGDGCRVSYSLGARVEGQGSRVQGPASSVQGPGLPGWSLLLSTYSAAVKSNTEPESALALQAAEKLGTEGGGGLNPRVRPAESKGALAPEGRNLPISRQTHSFSATCEAVPFQSRGHAKVAGLPNAGPVPVSGSTADAPLYLEGSGFFIPAQHLSEADDSGRQGEEPGQAGGNRRQQPNCKPFDEG
jgi:hypothetical protein